jgi:hypothetical protein
MFDYNTVYAVAVVIIPGLTDLVKKWLPQRVWALVPFAFGLITAGVWGTTEGMDIQNLFVNAFGIGGGATLLRNAYVKTFNPSVSEYE